MFAHPMHSKMRKTLSLSVALCGLTVGGIAFADELPRMDNAPSLFNQGQISNYHPVFDFDSDGCYPATPFNRNNNLSQNPGLNATGTPQGSCRDGGFEAFANVIHRQLCNERNEAQGRVRRCAHFYELYFEKDQALGGSFLGGHRHDVETVIVWTGRIDYTGGGSSEFVSHISASAHGNFDTRHINDTIHNQGHAYIVYHKDGAGTHAFRFANQGDRDRVEYIGNKGDFYLPYVLSHYRAYKSWNNDEWERYWQNRDYRSRLESSNFGSASFKTRNDGEIMWQANNAVPRSDSFWTNFSFTWDDVWFTRTQELKANYPSIYSSLPEQ
ncbi:NPP1 family protein [Archangium violaceum]|uniref:NPP1 family protein n=1 Tax=Archangium violaceum TaxID=83451 RepID=UPI0036D86CC0